MRFAKLTIALAALVLIAGVPALAFHDEGVAHCNGCHTMHNSADNPSDNPAGNDYLLLEDNSSDVCLACHATRLGAVWDADPLAPGADYGGGDFVFLEEDNLNDGHAGGDPANYIPGYQAGHNVLSNDKTAAVQDPVNAQAPGGSYFSADFYCTSCHDPHGQGGHFRLLYGAGYTGVWFSDATAPEFVADGIPIFGGGTGDANHTAYQDNTSAWCGSCHGNYHSGGDGVYRHPTDATLGTILSANYNNYDGTGNHANEDPARDYLYAVPVEFPGATTDYVGTVTGGARVTCMTCHQAHATSAVNAGRWDFDVTFLFEDGVESGSYAIPNPYPTVGNQQRSLCNKCHMKDPVATGP